MILPDRCFEELSGRTTGNKTVGQRFNIKDDELPSLAAELNKIDFAQCLT